MAFDFNKSINGDVVRPTDFWSVVLTVPENQGVDALSRGKYYSWKPYIPLFEQGKYIPLHKTGSFLLEFYLADPRDCLVSSSRSLAFAWMDTWNAADAPTQTCFQAMQPGYYLKVGQITNPTSVVGGVKLAYGTDTSGNTVGSINVVGSFQTDFPDPDVIIDDIRAHLHWVKPVAEYDAEIDAQIMSPEAGGLQIYFDDWMVILNTLSAAGEQQQTFQNRVQSVKDAIFIMKEEDQ